MWPWFHGRVVVTFLALDGYRGLAYGAVDCAPFFVLAVGTLAMPVL